MYKKVTRAIFKNVFMLFVAIHGLIARADFATNQISAQYNGRGCDELATGCCCFGQRSVQSSRGTWLAPTNPVSVDIVHKETNDPTAATTQTSFVRSDLQQTRSGRWRLSAHWLQ